MSEQKPKDPPSTERARLPLEVEDDSPVWQRAGGGSDPDPSSRKPADRPPDEAAEQGAELPPDYEDNSPDWQRAGGGSDPDEEPG